MMTTRTPPPPPPPPRPLCLIRSYRAYQTTNMGSQKRINPVIMDIHNSIMDIHNSILDIHNTIMDIHNIHHSIMDIHKWMMDVHNCKHIIMDIHNWIMDIHDYRILCAFRFPYKTPNLPSFHRILKVILEIGFQHIAHRLKIWIEFPCPLLAKLHENAFNGAAGSSDGAPVEGNCAVVRKSVVKEATSTCSPKDYNSNHIATNWN